MTVYACGLLVQDGKILLGKRTPHRRRFPDCWDVIGGKVEAGETVESALVRELGEEIGIEPTLYEHVGVVRAEKYEELIVCEMFLVRMWAGGTPSIRDLEHVEIAWFHPDEACALQPLALDGYRDFFKGIAGLI